MFAPLHWSLCGHDPHAPWFLKDVLQVVTVLGIRASLRHSITIPALSAELESLKMLAKAQPHLLIRLLGKHTHAHTVTEEIMVNASLCFG